MAVLDVAHMMLVVVADHMMLVVVVVLGCSVGKGWERRERERKTQ